MPGGRPAGGRSGLITEAFALQDAGRFSEAEALLDRADRLTADADPEYADVDEEGQLSIGVAGEQRAIPSLAALRPFDDAERGV